MKRLFLALAMLGSVPGVASAHAILMRSQPAIGAEVQPGHALLLLGFNSRIDAKRSRLTLIGPDHQPVVLPHGSPEPDELTAEADLVPGDYVLRWQVLAVDGHITRGDVRFSAGAP